MLDAAGRFGIAAEILKPGVQDAKRFIQQKAQEMETELEPGRTPICWSGAVRICSAGE